MSLEFICAITSFPSDIQEKVCDDDYKHQWELTYEGVGSLVIGETVWGGWDICLEHEGLLTSELEELETHHRRLGIMINVARKLESLAKEHGVELEWLAP